MRYWTRELPGWALVVLGLLAFLAAFFLAVERQLVEAWPMTIIGIFVFRGGIHLLKVAVAARICQQAQDRLYPASGAAPMAARAARPMGRTLPARRTEG
jgi:hypothetical protein